MLLSTRRLLIAEECTVGAVTPIENSSAFDATDFLSGTISHVIPTFHPWLRWTPPGLLGTSLNKSCCCRDREASYQSFRVELTRPETQSDIEPPTPGCGSPRRANLVSQL